MKILKLDAKKFEELKLGEGMREELISEPIYAPAFLMDESDAVDSTPVKVGELVRVGVFGMISECMTYEWEEKRVLTITPMKNLGLGNKNLFIPFAQDRSYMARKLTGYTSEFIKEFPEFRQKLYELDMELFWKKDTAENIKN